MTLARAALGAGQIWKQVAMVLAGTALIAVAAKIAVPFYPVPMTLQTLAVLFVGFAYGARLGAITLSVYLAEGLMGLPVFSPTTPAGIAAFVGPTAGFLVGFVFMAWAAGWVADRGAKRLVVLIPAALAISALLYVPGLAWPAGIASVFGIDAGWVGKSFEKLIAGWMAPFLIGDAVKAVIAALIVSGAWTVLRKKES